MVKKKPEWDHIDNKYELIAYLIKNHVYKIIALIISIGFSIVMIINIGYENEKGFYWKPAEISINKKTDK